MHLTSFRVENYHPDDIRRPLHAVVKTDSEADPTRLDKRLADDGCRRVEKLHSEIHDDFSTWPERIIGIQISGTLPLLAESVAAAGVRSVTSRIARS